MALLRRTRKGLKSIFGPGHSPAGKKYLKRKTKKKREIQQTGFSPQTKRRLQGLSELDYKEAMRVLYGKRKK